MANGHPNRTLREVVRVIASRFVGMVAILAIVLAATAAATYYAPRWYRSEVSLLATPPENLNPLEEKAATLHDRLSLFVVTQREIITSDHVLGWALMKLEGRTPQGSPAAGTRPARGPAPEFSDEQIQDYIKTHEQQMQDARERVSVVTPGGPETTFTESFTIRVDWPENRKEAAVRGEASASLAARQTRALAQHVMDAYLARYTELESRRMRSSSDFLTHGALAAAKARLDEATADLGDFIKNELKGELLQVVSMVGRASVGGETGVASLTTRFRGELTSIEGRLSAVRALRLAIERELVKRPPAELAVPDAVTANSTTIPLLQKKIVELKMQLGALQSRYTDGYQEIQNVKAELVSAESDLRSELTLQQTKLEQEIATLTAQRDTLARTVDEDRARVEALAGKATVYQKLASEADNAQKIYDAEQKRAVDGLTAERLAAAKPILVTPLDAPSWPAPSHPRRPIVWLNMVIALAAGLVLALVYAFLADHFDHSIKSIDGAERYLGVPVVGSVPRLGRIVVTSGGQD